MADQTKHRSRVSFYVLSTALIALGAASLGLLPIPAATQAPTSLPTCRNAQPKDVNAIDPFLDLPPCAGAYRD
jgi:hypothetical protein